MRLRTGGARSASNAANGRNPPGMTANPVRIIGATRARGGICGDGTSGAGSCPVLGRSPPGPIRCGASNASATYRRGRCTSVSGRPPQRMGSVSVPPAWPEPAAIAESAPQAPRLQSARLEHHQHPGPAFVVVRTPPAVRVLAYLALGLAHGLADIGIQCGIVADDCAVRDLTIIVSGDTDDASAAQVLAACGLWLTQCASRVSVPPAHYRAIRTCVYDGGGIGAVRRLVRQSVF